MKEVKTQGRQLIEALIRKPHTYGEMMQVLMWQSCSPWKRALESLRCGEELVKGRRLIGRHKNGTGSYLVTWRVVTVKK